MMRTFPPPPVDTIDWTDLKNFRIQDVNGHIESTYHKADDKWTPLKFVSTPYLQVHGLAPGLNYGQQVFEGLKAFRMPGKPGGLSLFRPQPNAARFQHSATMVNLPSVPEEMFVAACRAAVAWNAEYVPPHESGWAMYCRPLLFASGPMFPPGVPEECTFCVYVFPTPLGAQDWAQPVKALILDEYDRAAPKGIGHAKAGGNYAGALRWSGQARQDGFGITLHLDSARREHVDEFSLCGFIGIKNSSAQTQETDENVTIVAPESPSAVESINSDSVQQIGRSYGWRVEKRPVPYTELPSFSEVWGVGTAGGLVPVRSITRRGRAGRLAPGLRVLDESSDDVQTIVYLLDERHGGGPVFQKLATHFRDIQRGRVRDEWGWRTEVRAEDQQLSSKVALSGDTNGT